MSLVMTPFQYFCFLFALFLLPILISSRDPDPLQDFCVGNLKAQPISVNGFPCKPEEDVTSEDFFFDGLMEEGNTTNKFGYFVSRGHVLNFPGVNTLGISMNRVDIAPGGLNYPHSHPRSSEAGVVIKGKVLVGFITTNGKYFSKVMTSGQMFVVPPGLVHFQLNVGKKKALLFTSFNSQLPGSVVVATSLFATNPVVPDTVLMKAFQADKDLISKLRSHLQY